MIRAAAFLAALVLALPAGAETVRVLSGEHPGFTRLAFVFDQPTDWRFGRVDAAGGGDGPDGAEGPRLYELRLARGDVDLDISRVFDRVPRTRLEALTTRESRLRLTVAAGHRAVPFELRAGVMAIDIRPGPPPPDSPFETPLPTQVADTVQIDPATDRDGSRRAGGGETPGAAADVLAWSDYLWRRLEQGAAAPRRAPFRQSDIAPPFDSPSQMAVARDAAAPSGPGPLRPPGPAVDRNGAHSGTFGPSGARPPEPSGSLEAPQANGPERPGGAPAANDGAEADTLAKAQTLILEQIARAAAQGLVRAAVPDLPGLSATDQTPGGPVPPAEAQATLRPEPQPQTPTTEPQINVTAQTSMDRDGFARVRRALQGGPDACLAAGDLDVGSWGDGQDPARLIAEGRSALLGEFDRVRPDAVETLARRYVYLGFGAEAAALISAFPGNAQDGATLRALAAIVDGRPADADAPLARLAHCDSAAALWSLLSRPPGAPAPNLNVAAVRRSFSDLPGHLRTYLAPAVAERLIALGQIDAAASVRNAVARVAGPSDMRAEFLDARLALEAGDGRQDSFPQVEERLLSVVAHDGADRVPALLLYLDGRLARDLPVTREFATQTAALAFEYRNAPEGQALARAEILAQAASGDYNAAFAALARARPALTAGGAAAPAADPEVLGPLYDLLAAKAPDIVFLQRALAIGPAAREALRPDTLARLSGRLLALGFPAEAQRIREGEAADADARLFTAEASLALDLPRAALQQIAGIDGAAADRIRAAALADLGEAPEAIRLFAAAGDQDAAARTAWTAGDWAAYRRLRQDARSAALERLEAALEPGGAGADAPGSPVNGPGGGPAPEGDPARAESGASQTDGQAAPEYEGALARNRDLLERSRAVRAALADLRAALPAAQPGL